MFGRTEYEFLAEDENQDSEANLLHPAIVDLPKSVVGDKLNKISVMSRHTTISDKYTRATNVVENYKYYYLNLRQVYLFVSLKKCSFFPTVSYVFHRWKKKFNYILSFVLIYVGRMRSFLEPAFIID